MADTFDAVIVALAFAVLVTTPLFAFGWPRPKRAVRITYRVGREPGGSR